LSVKAGNVPSRSKFFAFSLDFFYFSALVCGMSAAVPTSEPPFLTAGDTWTWTRSFPDYPASSGWELSYALTSSTAQVTITASASGDDHLISVAAATTAAYTAGDYSWQAYVTLDAERYMVDSGRVTVRPNLAAASSGYDGRSAAAKALAAIESFLATGDPTAAEVQVEGRALKHFPILDLHRLRYRLQAEVANEQAAARAKELGLDPRRYKIRLMVD
jgi:hypothetical protein